MGQRTPFREELVRFALNEVFGEERKRLQQHIEECSCCQELSEIHLGMFALNLSKVAGVPWTNTRPATCGRSSLIRLLADFGSRICLTDCGFQTSTMQLF